MQTLVASHLRVILDGLKDLQNRLKNHAQVRHSGRPPWEMKSPIMGVPIGSNSGPDLPSFDPHPKACVRPVEDVGRASKTILSDLLGGA